MTEKLEVKKPSLRTAIITYLLFSIALAGIISVIYIKLKYDFITLKQTQMLPISENTVIYELNDGKCYIAESKTNGYVDIEIDCK